MAMGWRLQLAPIAAAVRVRGPHMGFTADRYAVTTASSGRPRWATVSTMADPRHIAPAAPEFFLTQSDFDALVHELEALRTKHRDELARRLREARAFGGSTENDDLLAVAEDAAFDRARIAQLEALVRLASVVDGPDAEDGAGLGSTVRVSDDAGRESEYVLIGRRDEDSGRYEVTMASPVGKALWGSRPGDAVTVVLPAGRSRTLQVLDVVHASLVTARAA